MKSDKPLSDLYQQYIAKKLEKKDFEGMIFQHLLHSFERFNIFYGNEDSWNEFLSWLYPRIARAIEIYQDQGSCFDAYITGLVYSAAKEYRFRELDHNITEFVFWRARVEEAEVLEHEADYSAENTKSRNHGSIPQGVNPRQVLFLLLKSYFFVSDEFVERVAGAIGIELEVVKDMIDELRKRRSEKEAEIHYLRERLHCQHYRCLTYQKKMTSVQPESEYYEKLKSRFERARKRFNAIKYRLGKMRLSASNRMIAEVMGIPCGTVDSGIFSIKNRLAHL